VTSPKLAKLQSSVGHIVNMIAEIEVERIIPLQILPWEFEPRHATPQNQFIVQMPQASQQQPKEEEKGEGFTSRFFKLFKKEEATSKLLGPEPACMTQDNRVESVLDQFKQIRPLLNRLEDWYGKTVIKRFDILKFGQNEYGYFAELLNSEWGPGRYGPLLRPCQGRRHSTGNRCSINLG